MRIIAGKHKSRQLQTLDGLDTRPMTDRMKESVFNTIGPYFDSDIVLDLFGGSGALSLESLSRGAGFAYCVEKSYQAMKVIRSNVTSLKENDNVTNLIIYNSIVSFPICQDKNIIKDAVLDGSVDNNL